MLLPKLLPIIVLSLLAVCSCTYYACPPTSLCVPPTNCPDGNITFSAIEDYSNTSDHSYVCGVFSQCEDLICCSDPVGLPMNYMPNKTHWCFTGQESNVTSEGSAVSVFPYPGLEEAIRPENGENYLQLCPSTSVCVQASACPQPYITFSFGMSDGNYTCGSGSDSSGYLCCMITSLGRSIPNTGKAKVNFLKNKKQESESSFVKSKSSNFKFADLGATARNIFANQQKFLKQITARSGEKEQHKGEWSCGRTLSIAKDLSRIYSPVGDRLANEGDYPWHVAILSSNYEYLCSGVIIDERTVLTIAHCLHSDTHKYRSSKDLLVRVGDLDLKFDNEINPAFDVKVELFVVHPKYEPINLVADIAILELGESLRNLQHVRPVCLPGGKYAPAINQCKVPGWGQFSRSKEEKDEFSYELRAASFYIIDKPQCQASLRRVKELGAFFKLQDNVLCAKGYTNSDTCKGDGGSGLVCRGKDIYVLKGLVSYGVGCGFDLPGVYTDVEKYLDFINNYKSYKDQYSAQGDRDGTGKDYIKIREEVSRIPTYDQTTYQESSEDIYVETDKTIYEPIYDGSDDYSPKKDPAYTDDYLPQEPSYLEPDHSRPYEPVYEQDSEYSGNPGHTDDYLDKDTYFEVDYSPEKPDYIEDVYRREPHYEETDSYAPHEPDYVGSDYVPSYESSHRQDNYVKTDYSRKPDYVEPDYHKPDYIEPDYQYKPDYIEPDYIEPDYQHKPDYIEPDYHKLDYVEPDYSHKPDYVQSDYHHDPQRSWYEDPDDYTNYDNHDYNHHDDYNEQPYDYPSRKRYEDGYSKNYEDDFYHDEIPHSSEYSDRHYDYSPFRHDKYSERGYYTRDEDEFYNNRPNYKKSDYEEPDYQRHEYDQLHRPDHDGLDYESDYEYLPHRPSHDYDHLSNRPGPYDDYSYSERDRIYYGDAQGYSYSRTAAKNVKSPSLKKGYAGKSPAVFTETLSAVMKNMENSLNDGTVHSEVKINSPISRLKKTV